MPIKSKICFIIFKKNMLHNLFKLKIINFLYENIKKIMKNHKKNTIFFKISNIKQLKFHFFYKIIEKT